MKTLTEVQVIEQVKSIIDKYCYLQEEDGEYRGEIYANYNDTLDERTIQKWFKSDEPREAFYDSLDEWYMECEWDYQRELIKDVEKHWDDEIIPFEEVVDAIGEWVREHVYYDWPVKHYLNQTVYLNIIVDTGDENYDYTLNCVYPHYNGVQGEKISDEASLVWLTKQQGYKKSQLNQALRKHCYSESELLKSIRDEIANCSTHMNALAFFVSTTLEEAFDLHEAMKEDSKNDEYKHYRTVNDRKGKGYIVLSKDTSCGLYDNWNGAGSVLEIKLEKDVVLPMKYISTALPDGCRGYGIDEIYGMSAKFWTDTVKEIKER